MNILSAFVVALGLSMDNFAVTIASGCADRGELKHARVLGVSVSFALAHVIMFCAGWWGGRELGRVIDRFDHWIAFFVLAFIGLKMIKEAFEHKEKPELCRRLSVKTVLALAVATSLDALLVGMALSLSAAPFGLTLSFLALCVLATSYSGFFLGSFLGRRFGTVMEVLGGAALLAVSVKVLLSGLGIW